ncbi:MAG: hypothetical protein M3478_00315 [Planctomycetota bacterium]|nr:hypothetical protein [Planctomycetota bacterium]
MSEQRALTYGRRRSHPQRIVLVVLTVALALLPAAIYGLRVLETMPYRPPADMRALLGGAEIAFVRVLIRALAITWFACAICASYLLVRRYRQIL